MAFATLWSESGVAGTVTLTGSSADNAGGGSASVTFAYDDHNAAGDVAIRTATGLGYTGGSNNWGVSYGMGPSAAAKIRVSTTVVGRVSDAIDYMLPAIWSSGGNAVYVRGGASTYEIRQFAGGVDASVAFGSAAPQLNDVVRLTLDGGAGTIALDVGGVSDVAATSFTSFASGVGGFVGRLFNSAAQRASNLLVETDAVTSAVPVFFHQLQTQGIA